MPSLAATPGIHRRRLGRATLAIAAVTAFAIAAMIVSLTTGPMTIPLDRIVSILIGLAGEPAVSGVDRSTVILLDIRLPRTLLAMIVGAATALSGTVMQGLFRNPLADPGIVGISSGAALAAAIWIVLGSSVLILPASIAGLGLPAAAFVGGLTMTLILHTIATSEGRTSVTTLLLAGIALTGLANAGIGLLIFVASDQQLREFTFWTLGSLGGATYTKIVMVLPYVILLLIALPRLSRALDALALGEAGAFHLGIDVERVKRIAVLGVAAAVGASVAVSGVIAFFGLAVPHLVRLALGPAHRLLLPVSGLLGAGTLVLADTVARTIVAPAELPLGILTAAIGGPIMLSLIAGRRKSLLGG